MSLSRAASDGTGKLLASLHKYSSSCQSEERSLLPLGVRGAGRVVRLSGFAVPGVDHSVRFT